MAPNKKFDLDIIGLALMWSIFIAKVLSFLALWLIGTSFLELTKICGLFNLIFT